MILAFNLVEKYFSKNRALWRAYFFVISKFMENFRRIYSAVPEKNCDEQTNEPTHEPTELD